MCLGEVTRRDAAWEMWWQSCEIAAKRAGIGYEPIVAWGCVGNLSGCVRWKGPETWFPKRCHEVVANVRGRVQDVLKMVKFAGDGVKVKCGIGLPRAG